MEVSSKHQLFVFAVYVISGMGYGAFFDAQRSIRKVFGAGKIRTLFEDLLFVLVCTAAAIMAGFIFNRGQMRYYQVMGLISGVLFYAAFLSTFTMKILGRLYFLISKLILKPIVMTIKIILTPFLKIYLIFKAVYINIKAYFLNILRVMKKRKNKVKKRMKML